MLTRWLQYYTIAATYIDALTDMYNPAGFSDYLSGVVKGTYSASKKALPKPRFSLPSFRLGLWGDNLAKKLHESRYLYATYGALDGLSNICSHWRYVFDLIYSSSEAASDDKLHEFLSSPTGAVFVGAEILAVIVYATIGNFVDSKDDNHPYLSKIALTWPYLRDCFKGSKNAYKGIRAALNLSSFASGTSLLPFVVPSSLILGALSIVNRLLMRYMYTQRKNKMKHNNKVIKAINELNIEQLDLADLEARGKDLLQTLQVQKTRTRRLAFVGAAYGGFIDGLYLYVGILTLVGVSGLIWLGTPVALFLIACSFFYGLTNIATRIYEEYDYQKKIDINVAQAELYLAKKCLEQVFYDFQNLNERLSDAEIDAKKQTLRDYFAACEEHRKVVSNLKLRSYPSAILQGVSYGMSAYSALASIIFAVSTITFLIMHSLPPVLVLTIALTVASGLFLMIGFAAHELFYQRQLRLKDAQKAANAATQLKNMLEFDNYEISQSDILEQVDEDDEFSIEKVLDDYIVIDDKPLFFYMELFEVIRSFFSGVGKGPKSVMTTFNALQEKGDDGYYHFDNWLLFAFTSVSSVIYAICLALRAYARGFGREPLDQLNLGSKTDSGNLRRWNSEEILPSTKQTDKEPTICRSNSISDFSMFASKSKTKGEAVKPVESIGSAHTLS